MILPHLSPPIWGLAFVLASSVLLWLLSLRLRDASIIDVFWGPGIAGVVDIAALMGRADGPRAVTALLLVNIWAFRLAAHIWSRHASAEVGGEDRRYAQMRRHFGNRWWWWSLIQVFLLQAILIWFIAAPLVAVMLAGGRAVGPLDYAGAALAAAGLGLEALADRQLAAFRATPGHKGKVMDKGLWAWSRHPNYFGECVMWWGYFILGFAASHAWWLVLSPVVMTFLLLKVSGVSLMEDGMQDRRPGYAEYQRRVSAFLPMRPRP